MTQLYKNSEGYFDPTAGKVLEYEERRRRKAKYLISIMLFMARESGFHVDTKIELSDISSGCKMN